MKGLTIRTRRTKRTRRTRRTRRKQRGGNSTYPNGVVIGHSRDDGILTVDSVPRVESNKIEPAEE